MTPTSENSRSDLYIHEPEPTFLTRPLSTIFVVIGLLAATGCAEPSASTPASATAQQDTGEPTANGVTAADAPATYTGAYFKRVTLVVRDLDRSLKIYRDILGFDVDNVSTSSEDSYSYPVFRIPAEAKLRFATLSAGAEQVRTLALTEVTGIDLPRLDQLGPGVPHMSASVIRVDDIEATFARIDELELPTTKPKYAGGTDFHFWERAFTDFDGHLIVLYEIDEGS